MKWQKKWPPLRQEVPEDIQTDIDYYEKRAAAFRAIPTSGLKKAGARTYSSTEDVFKTESKGHTLKDEFQNEMRRAFSEEDQLRVFERFVQKIMHSKTGYGGQPRERAEGIVLRLWQELMEDQGGG